MKESKPTKDTKKTIPYKSIFNNFNLPPASSSSSSGVYHCGEHYMPQAELPHLVIR